MYTMVKWEWLIIADDDPLGRNRTFDTACAADEQRAGQETSVANAEF